MMQKAVQREYRHHSHATISSTKRSFKHVPCTVSSTSTSSGTADSSSTDMSQVIDTVLKKVEGTDGGRTMGSAAKEEVDTMLEKLGEAGKSQLPRPLNNPLIYGNYNVAYTSAGGPQKGEPAGGSFRSGVGRQLFQTTGLYQSVIAPDIVTNKVEFKLFGIIPGAVGLRGTLTKIGEGEDTAQVYFQEPVLSLPGDLHIRIGPKSSVVLTTTYIDERIRLGKGSRGSLFVFTRGGASDTAGMDMVGLQRSSKAGLAVLSGFFIALLLGGLGLWFTGETMWRVGSLLLWTVGILVGSVIRKGGIVDEDPDPPSKQFVAS